MSSIPVFDLLPVTRQIGPALEARWRRIMESTAFVQGTEVKEFEAAYSRFLGAEGCVGVANGTDALILSLRALGAGPGDEVIVPAFTFFATAEAVMLVGATPIVADVEPDTLNLDIDDAEDRITAKTVGIIGVHLYGHPFDIDGAQTLCDRQGLWLVEDAAQAHGARWRRQRLGSFGDLATWSFYPSKNLGCFGDGGAVTSNRKDLLDRVRLLANHGQKERYVHEEIGANSRLDALQAAVLNCRLEHIDTDNLRRRDLAQRYRRGLRGIEGLELPITLPEAESVFHQYTVRSPHRDQLQAFLEARGIGTAIHYPLPLNQQPALKALEIKTAPLPVAEEAAATVLSLPMFPQLGSSRVDEICEAIRRFFEVG